MSSFNFKKLFFLWLLSWVALGALTGIIILLIGEFRETEVKILLTTLSIGGCSLTGLCSSSIYDSRYKIFSGVGILTSSLCFIIILMTIWVDAEILLNNWKLLETLIVLSVSLAHVSLLLIQPAANKYVTYLQTATISCISIVAFILFILIFGVFDGDDYFYRMLGVFAILDVAGTIGTVILNRFQRVA
jgi:hypothetical protein